MRKVVLRLSTALSLLLLVGCGGSNSTSNEIADTNLKALSQSSVEVKEKSPEVLVTLNTVDKKNTIQEGVNFTISKGVKKGDIIGKIKSDKIDGEIVDMWLCGEYNYLFSIDKDGNLVANYDLDEDFKEAKMTLKATAKKDGSCSEIEDEISVQLKKFDFTKGLVAYYKFDGNAKDSSGNGNDGTEFGGVNYVDGVVGKAASFDGVGDYIKSNNILSFNGQSAYSINGWFITSTGGQFVKTTKNGTGTSKSAGISIGIDKNSGKFSFVISSDGLDNRMGTYYDSYDYRDGQWHNFTVKYNGNLHYTGIKIFIDGIEKKTSHFTGNYVQDNISQEGSEWSANIEIARTDDLTGISYFKGQMDDFRIYSRALNESEIKELYKLGQSK